MKLSNQQIDIEFEEESMLPQRIGNHKVLSKDGSRIQDVHYSYDHRWFHFYNFVRRFVHKNLGRPCDKVFSEYLERVNEDKTWKKMCSSWDDAKSVFNNIVDTGVHERYYYDYYVDGNGILRSYLKDKPAHHKDHVFKKSHDVYKLRKEALPYRETIHGILKTTLGTDIAKKICYEQLSETEYKKYSIECNQIYQFQELVKYIISTEYKKKYPRYNYWTQRYGAADLLENIMEKIPVGEYITITKNQRIKKHAEIEDKKSKQKREGKKNQKAYNETLLHDLVKEKRARERRENLIKIQSHGMSETESFRGESYHGEQRKKH